MSYANFYSAASRHAEWVSVRRTVVVANVANASTPGYKAKDVEAFSVEAASGRPGLGVSHPAHFAAGGTSDPLVSTAFAAAAEQHHSGNTVSLDREMMKAAAVSREQSLNAGLMKAFNRLIAMSARG